MALSLLVNVAALSLVLLAAPRYAVAQQQQEDEEQEGQPAGQTVNLEPLILDSSGSMAEATNTGEPRIDAAKGALNEVIDVIPDDRGEQINVGFFESSATRATTPTPAGRRAAPARSFASRSRASTRTRCGPRSTSINRSAGRRSPWRWRRPRPISGRGRGHHQRDHPRHRRSGDARWRSCAIADQIHNGPKQITINVIGLGLEPDELAILQCIADNGGGTLVGAQNAAELTAALFTFLEELEVVVNNGFLEIEVIGGLWPRATVEGQTGATDAEPEGEPFTLEMTEPRVELAVGVYQVYWINPSGQETRIQVNIESERTTLIRGSLIAFPQGAGEIYTVKDLGGVVIWQDQFELGDRVWVLPGIYRIELLEVVGNPILLYADIQTLPGAVTHLQIWTAP